MESLAAYGYLGLFVGSFLAATILPFSSEILLTFLLLNGFDLIYAVGVATVGNVLGAVVNYGLGFGGVHLVLKKLLNYSRNDIWAAEKRFRKYGVISLFFAWVPVIGDPLTVVAGLLRINFSLFLLVVTAGKLARYVVVAISVVSLG
jgi:membrane protein YqaA with SNARE-associated domain